MAPHEWSALFTGWPETALRLVVALACGILLGTEREYYDKPAGVRTMGLIAVGACLFMILSGKMPDLAEGPVAVTRVDPSRIASYVVAGIGFLGGGAIIQSRSSVHGMTTAATIWTSAAIGMTAGAGLLGLALGTTALVLITLTALNPLRIALAGTGEPRSMRLLVRNDHLTTQVVLQMLMENDVRRGEIHVHRLDADRCQIDFTYRLRSGTATRLLIALKELPGVEGAPECLAAVKVGAGVEG